MVCMYSTYTVAKNEPTINKDSSVIAKIVDTLNFWKTLIHFRHLFLISIFDAKIISFFKKIKTKIKNQIYI